jgi:hypothetical protein
MFLLCRIVNGAFALLCWLFLGLAAMVLFQGGTFTQAANEPIAYAMLVLVFFLFDLIFRKKDSAKDSGFAGLWSVFFIGMISPFNWFIPALESLVSGTSFWLLILVVGFPLLVNTIYFFQVVLKKAKQEKKV